MNPLADTGPLIFQGEVVQASEKVRGQPEGRQCEIIQEPIMPCLGYGIFSEHPNLQVFPDLRRSHTILQIWEHTARRRQGWDSL